MEDKNTDVIDLRLILKRIKQNKWKFIIILPIVFGLSCAYVLCLPRYYSTEVKLVPEIETGGMGGTLGDLASSFGIDLSNMQSSDAISPLLYPDLMEDNAFVAQLFDIRVKSNFHEDLHVDTTFYAYLRKYQKKTPWEPYIEEIRKKFAEKPPKGGTSKGASDYDPYNVTKIDDAIMTKIRDNVSFSIDKKTAVITLSVKTQDPYICRQIADSIKDRLQDFITEYRTRKARIDENYYEKLTKEAKLAYEKSVEEYSALVDSNQDVILQTERSRQESLENEMQYNYNTYSTLQTQLQAAKAKVQERTPAFTLLKGAAVPVKPAGPKRMVIVGLILFLAFSLMLLGVIRKDIIAQLK